MALNKQKCKLIWDLNDCYDKLFTQWTKSWDKDLLQKMKLLRVITKNFEEQARWFLKSNLDYKKSGCFFLSEYEKLKYEELHSEITKILLDL